MFDPDERQPVGIRDPAQFGQSQPAFRMTRHEVSGETPLLHIVDRTVAVVVQHEKFDVQIQPVQGFQLLDIVLKSAVADHAHGPFPRCNGAADARRQTESHRAQSRRIVDPDAFPDRNRLHGHFRTRARTARDQQVVFAQQLAENFGQVVKVHQRFGFVQIFRQDHGVAFLPGFGAGEEFPAGQRGGIFRQHRPDEPARVRRIFPGELDPEFFDLVNVDVRHQALRARGKMRGIESGLAQIQPRAEDQDAVAGLLHEVRTALGDDAGPSGKQRMILRQEIRGLPAGQDRDLQFFDQFDEFRNRARRPDAVAGIDAGTLRRSEKRQDLPCRRRIIVFGLGFRTEMRQRVRVDRRALDIQRQIQPDRTAASVQCGPDRFFQLIRNGFRILDAFRIFRDRTDQRLGVHFLDPHLTDALPGHHVLDFGLTGKHQQRSGIDPCARHAGNGVGAAGSGSDQRNAEPIAVLRVTFRRNDGRLFVKIADVTQSGGLPQRIHQMHAAAARKHEHGIQAGVFDQKFENVIGNFDLHRNLPLLFDSDEFFQKIRNGAVPAFIPRCGKKHRAAAVFFRIGNIGRRIVDQHRAPAQKRHRFRL